jgi:hypothetical protein
MIVRTSAKTEKGTAEKAEATSRRHHPRKATPEKASPKREGHAASARKTANEAHGQLLTAAPVMEAPLLGPSIASGAGDTAIDAAQNVGHSVRKTVEGLYSLASVAAQNAHHLIGQWKSAWVPGAITASDESTGKDEVDPLTSSSQSEKLPSNSDEILTNLGLMDPAESMMNKVYERQKLITVLKYIWANGDSIQNPMQLTHLLRTSPGSESSDLPGSEYPKFFERVGALASNWKPGLVDTADGLTTRSILSRWHPPAGHSDNVISEEVEYHFKGEYPGKPTHLVTLNLHTESAVGAFARLLPKIGGTKGVYSTWLIGPLMLGIDSASTGIRLDESAIPPILKILFDDQALNPSAYRESIPLGMQAVKGLYGIGLRADIFDWAQGGRYNPIPGLWHVMGGLILQALRYSQRVREFVDMSISNQYFAGINPEDTALNLAPEKWTFGDSSSLRYLLNSNHLPEAKRTRWQRISNHLQKVEKSSLDEGRTPEQAREEVGNVLRDLIIDELRILGRLN